MALLWSFDFVLLERIKEEIIAWDLLIFLKILLLLFFLDLLIFWKDNITDIFSYISLRWWSG